MKVKKIPMRTCVVTNERFPKMELLRIVKTPEGETPLSSPVNLESAAKTFLDKTKWN